LQAIPRGIVTGGMHRDADSRGGDEYLARDHFCCHVGLPFGWTCGGKRLAKYQAMDRDCQAGVETANNSKYGHFATGGYSRAHTIDMDGQDRQDYIIYFILCNFLTSLCSLDSYPDDLFMPYGSILPILLIDVKPLAPTTESYLESLKSRASLDKAPES